VATPPFVHIHTHTHYSKFDGFIKIPALIERVKELGMPGIGLTDHGTVAGAIEFLKACREEDVTPIIGMEAYMARDHTAKSIEAQPDGRRGNRHINVIAKNYAGLQNLFTLSQRASLDGFYHDPRIDFPMLVEHSDNIIVTSACPSNLINWQLAIGRYDKARQTAGMLKDVFGDDFYLEVMWHGLNIEAKLIPEIQKLAADVGVKIIATNDCHYLHPDDSFINEVLMCIHRQCTVHNPARLKFPYGEFTLKSPEEMAKIFGDNPHWLYNTIEIMEKCNYDDLVFMEDGGDMRLPKFEIPPEFTTPHQYLRHLAEEGIQRLGLDQSQPHRERLDRELGDIDLVWQANRYDFATYFLIVNDIISFARKQGIPSGVRGSGYGSFLLYCLGCTEGPDPLTQDLLWERFLGFTEKRFLSDDDFGLGIVDSDELAPRIEPGDVQVALKQALEPYDDRYRERARAEFRYLRSEDILDSLTRRWKKVLEYPYIKGNDNKLNCLLGFLLGITTRDPLACEADLQPFSIPKRRTYARAGFPDVDMDFCTFRRAEVMQYIKERFGEANVGQIGTILVYHTKSAIRQAVKVLDPNKSITYDEKGKVIHTGAEKDKMALENEIMNIFPKGDLETPDGKPIESVQEACDAFPEFAEKMEQYPEIKEVAEKLHNVISAFGKHAGGVIISPVPLERICPLHTTGGGGKSGAKRSMTTQFTMEEVESLGLIKIDILGVATKTAVDWAVRDIKAGLGVDIDLARIPITDQATIDMLKTGHTDGCFQLEGYGMQKTLQDIKVDSFNDLVLTVAMFRPGPKQYIPEICQRKNHGKAIVSPHPLTQDITSPTYGILAYQEQIMYAFMACAGLDLDDGYVFMKGCAKKKPKIIASYKDQFFAGAKARGIDQDTIERIWSDLEKFAGYSFNKSHAVSYTYDSWKTAYLKRHFPEYFIAARMSVESERREFDKVLKYRNDAVEHFGFSILASDLNLSGTRWLPVGERSIREPLIMKDIGVKAAEEIIRLRPYEGHDAFEKFSLHAGAAINKTVVAAMVDAGLWKAFPGADGRVRSRAELVPLFDSIRSDKKRLQSRGLPVSNPVFFD